MLPKTPIADPAQRDLVWTGYDPRALAPAIVLAGVTSLVVWTGRWFFEDLSDLADRLGSLVIFALAWGVWPALTAVFLYRTVMFMYRLTDRALLVDFGLLSRPVPPIALSEVMAVVMGGGWVLRRFGVGWIEIRTADRVIRLPGVRDPQLFAVAIRDAVGKLKGQS
jgi:membrane protein YdbS with pleckstrin-like domain